MSKLNEKTVAVIEKIIDRMDEQVGVEPECLDKLADTALKLLSLAQSV